MPKDLLLGKSYQRNQIHLHWTKLKILIGYCGGQKMALHAN